MTNLKFFRCEHCGNIIEMVMPSGVPVVCCGDQMMELVPGTTDGAVEKHVPVITVEENRVHVAVGSVAHPMVEAHYIQFIAIETSNGVQRKNLNPGESPEADFVLADGEELVAAYEYCNIHGLWKSNK